MGMSIIANEYKNIPKERIEYIKNLGNNKKDFIAFYNLKSEKKFDGHENEYVVIVNGEFKGFFNTFSDASDCPDSSGGIAFRVDEVVSINYQYKK